MTSRTTSTSGTNEIIMKQWGSQEQLLVNIQNIRPYRHLFSTNEMVSRHHHHSSSSGSLSTSRRHLGDKSQQNSPIPPFHIHLKVISYALSEYDVQCRTGKFAFLTRMQTPSASLVPSTMHKKDHGSSSIGGGNSADSQSQSSHNNAQTHLKQQNILRLGYEVYGKVLQCGNAIENISQGDFVIGFLSTILPSNPSYAQEGLVAIYEPEVVAPVWHFLRVPPSLLLAEGGIGTSVVGTSTTSGNLGGTVSGTKGGQGSSTANDRGSVPSTLTSAGGGGGKSMASGTLNTGIGPTGPTSTMAPNRRPKDQHSLDSSFVHENQLVGAILPGIRAYMAFSESCGQLKAGELILITDAASSEAHVAVQVAANRGAKVFCAVKSEHEWNLVQDLGVDIARVIDERREKLMEVILEETGGMGLDWIMDTHGTLKIDEIVPMMAPHSKILTTSVDAQYSMAICRQLLLKNITLSFMCELTYVLSNTQQGKLLHMLKQIVNDLKNQRMRVNIHGVYTPEKIREAHRQLENESVHGRIILRYAV
mmetsp:Transcript_700/g.2351  ORF Transcript_700/g.2351 Transcript_700/m.2351 type:complete len:535 (-) Transcript_700:147-1751(-)